MPAPSFRFNPLLAAAITVLFLAPLTSLAGTFPMHLESPEEKSRPSPALRDAFRSLGLIGASFALDEAASRNLSGPGDRWPDRAIEEPGEFAGGPVFLIAGTGALGAAGLVFHRPAMTRTSKEITMSLAASTAAATLIKVISDRRRPNGKNDYSFPSGHATGAFAVATVLDREFGGWAGPIAYGVAGSVGFSRMGDRYHYLSDVVAGAVLGHFIGKWVTHRPVTVPSN